MEIEIGDRGPRSRLKLEIESEIEQAPIDETGHHNTTAAESVHTACVTTRRKMTGGRAERERDKNGQSYIHRSKRKAQAAQTRGARSITMCTWYIHSQGVLARYVEPPCALPRGNTCGLCYTLAPGMQVAVRNICGCKSAASLTVFLRRLSSPGRRSSPLSDWPPV